MPQSYWLPLLDLREPAPVEWLHGAFSAWFDAPADSADPVGADGPDASAGVPHDATMKPYTISPVSQVDGCWGIEVNVLTEDAAAALLGQSRTSAKVRLGRTLTRVGSAQLQRETSWAQLGTWDRATAWTVRFLTPASFRTGNRVSPFPAPPVLLRSPADAWRCCGPEPAPRISPTEQPTVWVSQVDIETVEVTLKQRRYPGVLGSLTLRCDDPAVAPRASALLRLAQYSGVGSFRGKGMGIVAVDTG